MSENKNKIMKKIIEEICKAFDLNQKQLAELIGVSKESLSEYKKNDYKKVVPGRVKLVVMYYGEVITDVNILKDKLDEVEDNKVTFTEDDFKEDPIKVGQAIIKKLYEEKKDYELAKDFMKEHYPKFMEMQKSSESDSTAKEESSLEREESNSTEVEVVTKEESSSEREEESNSTEVEVAAEKGTSSDGLKNSTSSDYCTTSQEAIKWSQRVQENMSAIRKYEEALKLKKKNKEFISHLKCSAEFGYPPAMLGLGICYLNGTGVEENQQKAIEYFFQVGKMREEKASLDAVYYMMICYRSGMGVERDKFKAIWLKKLLKKNNYGCTNPEGKIDLSLMDIKSKSWKEEKMIAKEKWKNFKPETEEDRKLKELIEIWGGVTKSV